MIVQSAWGGGFDVSTFALYITPRRTTYLPIAYGHATQSLISVSPTRKDPLRGQNIGRSFSIYPVSDFLLLISPFCMISKKFANFSLNFTGMYRRGIDPTFVPVMTKKYYGEIKCDVFSEDESLYFFQRYYLA